MPLTRAKRAEFNDIHFSCDKSLPQYDYRIELFYRFHPKENNKLTYVKLANQTSNAGIIILIYAHVK